MKIVIAPDSYKESLSASGVATAIEAGFREIFPDATYVKIPVADGGEGTVEAMVAATAGSLVNLRVTGPLGAPVDAFYGLSGDARTAFIEMAAASGLELVPAAQRDPLTTTSFGTGELIKSALDKGVGHIILGIGRDGASAIFGPQKGATPQLVEQLDSALAHYAAIIQRDLDIDVLHIPGGGAAGGMGAALHAFCQADLRRGIEIVTEALGLAEQVRDASLVITGEGRIDSQSINGKVPIGVAQVAKRFNKPVIGIAGSLAADVGVVHQHGLDAVFSVLYSICTLEEALTNAETNLRQAARNIAATLKIGGAMR